MMPNYLPPLPYSLVNDGDSYKSSHFLFYRHGTTTVYSYIESRGGRYADMMWAGLQPLLYEKLAQPITQAQVDEEEAFCVGHGVVFNRLGWDRILKVHGGRLPLKIRAVPEGLVVPVRNAMFSVENLDEHLPWLTSYFETMLLRDIWTACSIATRLFLMRVRIDRHWRAYSENPPSPFALLDFSSRGVMGYDHGRIGGAAYLFMFQGSDNKPAVRHTNYYYHHDMAGFSINATEHSIACAFGRDNDDDYIDHCLEQAPEGSAISLVGDTWNIYRFCEKLAQRREYIANKRLTVVARPDSGEIKEVIPRVLKILAQGFGVQRNRLGRDVINLGVKALQGDGMHETTHMLPFELAEAMRIAPDSVLTGAGGGLMTADLDRDTMKFAMKCSEQVIDGERLDIVKDPITDPGKRSKAGRFALMAEPSTEGRRPHYRTIQRRHDAPEALDLMEDRFISGEVVNATTLDQVRERVDAQVDLYVFPHAA